jgi:hypothetical protein
MAIGKPGCQTDHGVPTDHGIVKARAGHFKKIRHRTVKNRFSRVWARARTVSLEPLLLPRGFDRRKLSVTGCRSDGCQVRHAPLQAVRCIRTSAATRRLEYTDILNKPLKRIVFVPANFVHARTLHHSSHAMSENLRMIPPCAVFAETTGTCLRQRSGCGP